MTDNRTPREVLLDLLADYSACEIAMGRPRDQYRDAIILADRILAHPRLSFLPFPSR